MHRLLSRIAPSLLIALLAACGSTPPPELPEAAGLRVPLYGMFETEIRNGKSYQNPFSDVTLNAQFTSPSGKVVRFWGFYDGVDLWRQRFMPNEIGTWFYTLSFSDGSPGAAGSFNCVEEGAQPGPWRRDPDNPRWLRNSLGQPLLPVAVYADCHLTPLDWRDMLAWCKNRGFNTLVVPTFNSTVWGSGWENVTAWATLPSQTLRVLDFHTYRKVDYSRFNLDMWREWDDMLRTAAANGIYIGSFNGPSGKYGGQAGGQYPTKNLVFEPRLEDRFDSESNVAFIRYFLARQAAFWNVAYWSLGNTEVFSSAVKDKQEFLDYGSYLASIAPFGRMITAQDCEQVHGEDRRWLSELDIPAERKLNSVQTAPGNCDNPEWQNAAPNNALALDAWGNPPQHGGFPVITTEGLWEGQGRAQKPLRIIWSFYAAGAHTVWADWSYENGNDTFGSNSRGLEPVKSLEQHLFGRGQLGADCEGDEQLLLAAAHINSYEYWKMEPHNELVEGGAEAYCLAEPGRQYMVYAPSGGDIRLDLAGADGALSARWFNPRDGSSGEPVQLTGGEVHTISAPDKTDWVLGIRPPQ